MSSDDIKTIIKRFYVLLRRNIDPSEITTEIDGLTPFDVQQITAVTKNEGKILGNDKLLDALQRRSTRTFVSFLCLVEQSYADIGEKMIDYMKNYHSRIYDSFEQYKSSYHERPQAAVRPLIGVLEPGHNPPLAYERHTIHERTEVTQRAQQATIIREQESRDTYSRAGITVQSVQRTTETRQVDYTEAETPLDEVPNALFEKWALKLNEDNAWQKLGSVFGLKRKEVKEIKTKENPGEEILDRMSSENEPYTVKGLMHLLECAELKDVLQTVRGSLAKVGPEMSPDKNTTETQTSQETNQLDRSPSQAVVHTSIQNIGPDDIENGRPRSHSNPNVPENILPSPEKPLNRSDTSYDSIVNNEEAAGTEEVIVGAEKSLNKTLINNLNTTKMNFDKVGSLHIHLQTSISDGEAISEEKIQNAPSKSDGCFNRETSSDSNLSPTMPGETNNQRQDYETRVQTNDDHMSRQNSLSGKVPPDSLPSQLKHQFGRSLPHEDSPERSFGELEQKQGVITQPEDCGDTNYEKNLQQEVEALGRDLQNQVNLDSYRDIQNSIPGTSLHGAALGPVCGSGGTERISSGQIRIQSPESRNTSLSHAEKNVEQESEALRRDLNNQPNPNSFLDIRNENERPKSKKGEN